MPNLVDCMINAQILLFKPDQGQPAFTPASIGPSKKSKKELKTPYGMCTIVQCP